MFYGDDNDEHYQSCHSRESELQPDDIERVRPEHVRLFGRGRRRRCRLLQNSKR